jgi:peptide/nickel transport system permease protein
VNSRYMDDAGKNNGTQKFKKQGQMKEFWRRYKKNKLAMFGLIVMSFLVLLILTADFVAPYSSATVMNLKEKLQGPSANHLFGTDGYGRDLFARCIHGARISLLIGFTVSFATTIIGSIFGLMAGYYGQKIDNLIMRTMDILAVVPAMLMALAVISALGSSLINLMIALTISSVPLFARVMRSAVLGVAEQEYVEAAKAGGIKDVRLFLKHILPNAMGPIIVQTTLNIAIMILTAATMSFLGLGVKAPMPEWGAIISEAREYMRVAPHIMLFPGAMISLTVLAISLMGDGLRDSLDPRLKS